MFDGNFLKPEIFNICQDENEKFFNYDLEKDQNYLKCVDKKEKEFFEKDYYFKKDDDDSSCKNDEGDNGQSKIINDAITKKMEIEF